MFSCTLYQGLRRRRRTFLSNLDAFTTKTTHGFQHPLQLERPGTSCGSYALTYRYHSKRATYSLHASCECFWFHVLKGAGISIDAEFGRAKLCPSQSIMPYAWQCMNPRPDVIDDSVCSTLELFEKVSRSQLHSFSAAMTPQMVVLPKLLKIDGLDATAKACLRNVTCFEANRSHLILHAVPWSFLRDLSTEILTSDGRRVVRISEANLKKLLSLFTDDAIGQFARQVITGMILSSPNYWLDVVNANMIENFPSKTNIWLSEFNYCAHLSYWRGAEQMPLNLQLSFDHIYSQDEQDIVFMTASRECAVKANTSLRHVWDISDSVLMTLTHCERDVDSYSRVVAIWELIKRGHSVFSLDPDIVLLKKFPSHIFESDFSFAMYADYTHIGQSLQDFTSQLRILTNSINFGTWYWSNSSKAMVSFASFYLMYLYDLQGARSEEKKYDTTEDLRHDLGNVNQICDDQAVHARYYRLLQSENMLHSFSFGEETVILNGDGVLHDRRLLPTEMALAIPYIRASDSERSTKFHALHMSTFGSWKVHGLRELGLWFVPTPVDRVCEKIVSFDQSSFDSLSSREEEHAALLGLLSVCDHLNVTIQLPLLDCAFVTNAPLVQQQRSHCEWFFQYDLTALVDSGIKFVTHNHNTSSPRCSDDVHTEVIKNITASELAQRLKSLLATEVRGTTVRLAGDLSQLSSSTLNVTRVAQALTEAVRIHGCC